MAEPDWTDGVMTQRRTCVDRLWPLRMGGPPLPFDHVLLVRYVKVGNWLMSCSQKRSSQIHV